MLHNGNIDQVYSINYRDAQMCAYWVRLQNGRGQQGAPIYELDPIPLSKDIVNKIGFKLVDDYCFEHEGVKIWQAQQEKGFYHINSEFITYIDYVHELQNWYYFNTKEELKINNI